MRLITADNFIKHKEQILQELRNSYVKPIKLAIVQVGNDLASNVYINNKIKTCKKFNIDVIHKKLPENITKEDLAFELMLLDNDSDITGILLQLPLPQHLSKYENELFNYIDFEKDVDCLSDISVANLVKNNINKFPCTPQGIYEWLKFEGVEWEGKNVVIINRSMIVGKPLANMLINAGSTVSVCHSKTDKETLKLLVKNADIIIVGVGKAGFFSKKFDVKDGAYVIDVGINRDGNGKLCGDVKVEDFIDKNVTITKVPGGVGKVTTLMVINNLL